MSQQITLQMPEKLYRRLRKAAEASARSVEELLLESAGIFFSSEIDQSALETLTTYSNEQLWGIVLRRLDETQALRLHDLSAEQKHRMLTSAEENELDYLLDLTDRLMLLRSEALLLLKQRGEDVDAYLQFGA